MFGYEKNMYDISDVEMMVLDFISDEQEMGDLHTIGSPYYSEELGTWCQDAEDETAVYTLFVGSDGSVLIGYGGAK